MADYGDEVLQQVEVAYAAVLSDNILSADDLWYVATAIRAYRELTAGAPGDTKVMHATAMLKNLERKEPLFSGYLRATKKGLTGFDRVKESYEFYLALKMANALEEFYMTVQESKDLTQFVVTNLINDVHNRAALDAFLQVVGRRWPNYAKLAGIIPGEAVPLSDDEDVPISGEGERLAGGGSGPATICQQCGAGIQPDWVFCKTCGNRVG